MWVYSPTCPDTGQPRHKTAWAGKAKLIYLGPELQRILTPWLDSMPAAEFCFSPAKQLAHHLAARAAARQTKRTPSELARLGQRKPNPKKTWGAKYSESSYANAIEAAIGKVNLSRACDACKALGDPEPCARCALPEREGLKGPRVFSKRCRTCRDRTRLWCEACRAQAVPHWHPNQLRHLRLTELERRYGILDAQRVAGHSSPATTQIYLEEDRERLYAIAMQDG